jgi:hypothetical protein
MRSANSRMNVLCGCEARRGTVLQRGGRVESTRAITLAWLAKNTDSDVVRCVVSGNASAGRTLAETEVKRKYLGLGRPTRCRETMASTRERMISAPPARGIKSLSKYFLSADRPYLRARSERRWEWSIAIVRFSQERT